MLSIKINALINGPWNVAGVGNVDDARATVYHLIS